MKVNVGPLERRGAAGKVCLGRLVVGEENVVVALADGTALEQRLAAREVSLRLLEVGTRRLLGGRRGARIRLVDRRVNQEELVTLLHVGTFDEVPLEDRALHQRAHFDPVRRLRFGGELEHRRHRLGRDRQHTDRRGRRRGRTALVLAAREEQGEGDEDARAKSGG